MKFAKLVFLVPGVYGSIVLLPQYFFEGKTGRDFPPSITHPEFYYGFIGVTVAWQLFFLSLSKNPERYRPMMIPAILEKALLPLAIVILFFQHRVSPLMLGFATIDVLLGVLFIIADVKTPTAERQILS